MCYHKLAFVAIYTLKKNYFGSNLGSLSAYMFFSPQHAKIGPSYAFLTSIILLISPALLRSLCMRAKSRLSLEARPAHLGEVSKVGQKGGKSNWLGQLLKAGTRLVWIQTVIRKDCICVKCSATVCTCFKWAGRTCKITKILPCVLTLIWHAFWPIRGPQAGRELSEVAMLDLPSLLLAPAEGFGWGFLCCFFCLV